MSRRSGITVPLLGLGLVLLVLHWSGHGALGPPPLSRPSAWSAWLAEREPIEAAFALIRLFGITVGWYAVVTLAVGAGLRSVRAARLVGIADRLTPAVLRRVLAGTATLSLISAGPLGLLATAGATGPSTSVTTVATETNRSEASDGDVVIMRRLPGAAAAAAAAATEWTVSSGQSFWTIADAVLGRAWDRPPTDAEIVPYWLRLIEANRADLKDPANPDLVFPGQVFIVPSPG